MTPLRPMLGAVLDALTVPGDSLPSFWLSRGRTVAETTSAHCVLLDPAGGLGWRWDWLTTDPAEALELLQARDLVPMGCVSRFVCEDCGGRGSFPAKFETGEDYTFNCLICNRTGHRPHPPTVAALASWTSLGWAATDDGHPGIAGAEEWALAMVGVPAAWWRVGPVERDGVVPGRARSDLAAAGFGWSWNGRRPDGVTLTVPPLGSLT